MTSVVGKGTGKIPLAPSYDSPHPEVPMTLTIELELPDDLARFRLPRAVAARLQSLLDRQDSGEPLTAAERDEAEGLVNLAELLTLLRLRAERIAQ